tara:strand:- start:161 stop:421 length:261 start_codon:yes stop_codon:yes gene_type:complete
MIRQCDTGGICPHTPQCDHFCHFTNAENEPETRKVKPYPEVPADIETETENLHTMGSILLGLAIAVLVVFFGLMIFTGLWIWSLLI